MAKIELTDAFIRSLAVAKRTEVSDARERGLTLRVSPSGRKVFSFRMRGANGKVQRANIGPYPDYKLAEARAKASELRRCVHSGENITASSLKEANAVAAELQINIPTLDEILGEYQHTMSERRKIWHRPSQDRFSDAEKRIRSVFGEHLQTRVTDLALADLVRSMQQYAPKNGKPSANGQVSRARSYLMPVLDWCSHRNRFHRIGSGRHVRLTVVDMRQSHDPAVDDHRITGFRDRALDHHELKRVLPLLVWPAPACLNMKLQTERDFRPIALRFILLTCARREEVAQMKWHHFRSSIGVWHKPYVKTVSGPPRQQNLPLSDAAIELLASLPGYSLKHPDAYVFPNEVGGKLDNWGRVTAAIHRESRTTDWHRHDLRRTGATIMKVIGISPRTIDEILAHNASRSDDGTSRALENYFASGNLLEHVDDPQKTALDRLAEALGFIELQNEAG